MTKKMILPKYGIGDWVTWKRIVGRESRICSDCGQRVYGTNIKEDTTGEITSIETFRNSDSTRILYGIRVEFETEVIQIRVTEESIIEEE